MAGSSSMKYKLMLVVALLLSSINMLAAGRDSTINVKVSLITCYPGSEIYELYGHTMLRVRYAGVDVVYNYGIFDFDAPNFMYRFVKGDTDYKVVGYSSQYSLLGYENRKVVEQELNLTPQQAAEVANALHVNALPENAVYRYNYIYDNCATRPRDMVEKVLGNTLHYPAMRDTLTFREEMRRYNANYAWQQFGIDLVLGSGIDYELDYREQMFVPMVLMDAYAGASIERRDTIMPLVSATHVLNPGADTGDVLPPTPGWMSPLAVSVAMLLLTVALSVYDIKRRKVSRWFDSLLFGFAGVCGLLIFFLIFISTHAATSPNLNGIWLHPFSLLPAILIWIKKAKRVLYFYHFLNFAVIVLLLVSWPFLPQAANMAVFPFMLCLATRSLNYIVIFSCKCTKINK